MGSFLLEWSFSDRNGQFGVTNFDGGGFGGSVSQVGTDNLFRDADGLSGSVDSDSVFGTVNGSFVNDGAGRAAGGAIGNFTLRGSESNYRATGIFAGPRVPPN